MFLLQCVEGFSYCGFGDQSAITMLYLSGPPSMPLDDMDVDCDGINDLARACSNDPTGQGQTAFQDTVATYGISDLNANIHGYVVFGNDGASPSFDPQSVGIQPLSVMAVVCNNQLV
jgi:chitosanase